MRTRSALTVLVTICLVVLLVFPFVAIAPAGSDGKEEESSKKTAPDQPATSSSQSDGQREGITVHGRWTIEVLNPDGTVVTRREFDNALVSQQLLTLVLARQRSVGIWLVTFAGSLCPSISTGGCAIGQLRGAPGSGQDLTATSTSAGLVLTGSVMAARDGTIDGVGTANMLCSATTAPSSSCPFDVTAVTPLTQATLSPGVSVSAGQFIRATVTISFGTLS